MSAIKNISTRFVLGDRVADRETGERGVVVHAYDEPEIAGVLVAVMFDASAVPLAVHVDDLVKVPL